MKDLALERGFGEIVKTIDEIERRRERRRKHRSSSSTRSLLSPSHSIQSSPSSLSPVHHSQERQRRRRELESAVTLGRVLEAEFQRKEQREGTGSSEEEEDENSSILSNSSSSSSLDDNFISDDESSLEGGHTSESTNSLLRGNLSSNPIPSFRDPSDRIHFMTNDPYSDLDEEEEVGNSRMSDDEIKRHIRSQLSSMSIQSPSISNHLNPINRNQPHPTSKTSSSRKSHSEKDSSNDIMKTNDNKKMDDDQEEEIECEVMKGYPITSSSDDQKIEWLRSHLQEERRKYEEEHHKVSLSFLIHVVNQNKILYF